MEYVSTTRAEKAEMKKLKKKAAERKRLERRSCLEEAAEALLLEVDRKEAAAMAAAEAARNEVKRREAAAYGIVFREDLVGKIKAEWEKYVSEFSGDCSVIHLALELYRSDCRCSCTPDGRCGTWKKRNELLHAQSIASRAPSIHTPFAFL
uniref:Uncharacterized protein n=1 Tax=viral metagenome TaxID=1070528 RepID=A0A6C0K9D1_9ZZZZ